MVLSLPLRIGGNVDHRYLAEEKPGGFANVRYRRFTKSAAFSGQENKWTSGHYGDPTMRPATAAVIIGLLVLILGSSLIWLQRSF